MDLTGLSALGGFAPGSLDGNSELGKKNEGVAANQFTDLRDGVQEAQEGIQQTAEMPAPEVIHNFSPEVPEAVVTGDPEDIAKKLDFSQGDNSFNALGDCGLVSCSNLLEMAGIDADENTVVQYALQNGLCDNPDPNGSLWSDDGENRGGTNPDERVELLKHFGVDATEQSGLSPDQVADAVESGKGVLISVNAGELWNDPQYVADEQGLVHINHEVTVTGVARDATTGDVEGFYICDSGRSEKSDAARFITVDDFNRCHSDMPGESTLITDQPIR